MSIMRIRHFIRDEAGVATIWSLFWCLVMIGFAGFVVDSTDGLRHRTMLQATADSAALAGAIELPDRKKSRDTAVLYARGNMGDDQHGQVVDPTDVYIGKWDAEKSELDQTAANPDAIMVTAWRGEENVNPVPVSFLRLLGLDAFNVRAQAVAQRYIPPCLRNGLIAKEEVHISSNNHFTRDICVHGERGVKIQSNNTYDPGVVVSMYDIETLQLPTSGYTSNDGLREALREAGRIPRDPNHVDEIMLNFLDPEYEKQPKFINTSNEVQIVDEKFDLSTAKPHHIYHVQCKPNKNAQIPSNAVIQHVTIIADCELHIGTSSTVMNSILGSRSGGNGSTDKANVKASAKVQLGQPDNCADGGGVQIYSNATIQTSASTKIDGVQMVAAGDIDLGAQDYGINGISAQSGQNITLTSNNIFGLCQGGVPDHFMMSYYRLVI